MRDSVEMLSGKEFDIYLLISVPPHIHLHCDIANQKNLLRHQ